jgi:DNA polymerase/3'-5' exonuclease PolX
VKDLGGGHVLKVIKDLLTFGESEELSNKLCDGRYLSLQTISGVFGIGKSLSQKLYGEGIRTVRDLEDRHTEFKLFNDERSKFGLAFYDDLNDPVDVDTAKHVERFIRDMLNEVADEIDPKLKIGIRLEMVGGFRRGKSSGHDVDFLLGHEELGTETKLLQPLVAKLKSMNLMIFGRIENFESGQKNAVKPAATTMDNYERCLSIIKVPKKSSRMDFRDLSDEAIDTNMHSLLKLGNDKDRQWRATRVDLVVPSKIEWYYAVVGWTGSSQYMRILRRHASSINRALNSHCMWDLNKGESLPANSEEDVFRNLKLDYREPYYRNF